VAGTAEGFEKVTAGAARIFVARLDAWATAAILDGRWTLGIIDKIGRGALKIVKVVGGKVCEARSGHTERRRSAVVAGATATIEQGLNRRRQGHYR
jgi:hypothetical protein